jgi:peptidoglycan/LPS O-acetylase OafA/YrhL
VPKVNNFDLIRLAAALQVAITHSIPLFLPGSRDSPLLQFIQLFPGVPIFFFVSGFLISKSFERNSVLREYALNRILRIYPALIVCFLVSLIAVALTGYFSVERAPLRAIALWILAQISFGQFYNPDFMRHFGTGVLNGSMWTITVELQFYALLPVLYAVFRAAGCTLRRTNWSLGALIVLFWGVNYLYVHGAAHHADQFWFKLVGVSFLPWFGMFLVGVFFQRNAERIYGWLRGRLPLIFVAYAVIATLGNSLLKWNLGNTMSAPLFLALVVLVFCMAYSNSGLSDRLLKRNDISYGVYIYHMLAANLLMALGFRNTGTGFILTMCATLVFAVASWKWIEKPALAWKRHPLYPHSDGAAAGDRWVRTP